MGRSHVIYCKIRKAYCSVLLLSHRIAGPWPSAEAAEDVIKTAENKVHIIFADLVDGKFIEFVSFKKDGTPNYPEAPPVMDPK